jgi:hypothetical protein
MIYFIVTTSLFNNCPIREFQYIIGIQKLKDTIDLLDIKDSKVIIIENNGLRNTFLNAFGEEVYYTENNYLPTNNKGYKELQDIFDCIQKYNIQDDDFIVKMTGRYILNDNSEFMHVVQNIQNTKYNCLIKYGSFFEPVNYKINDCITGLIGMSCFYVKQISKPTEHGCVEHNWATIANSISDDKIYIVDKLGIYICPGCNEYFSV